MTTTEESTDIDLDSSFTYTSKNTSPPVEPAIAGEEEDLDAKPAKPWFSGFCGAGPECKDETREIGKSGEPIRRCRYVAENGAKAPRRYLYCGCGCHQDSDRAGQAVDRS